MGAMSASDAAPLPRLGEVFFDVRGNSRSMRLSWYADTGVAVLSIWQGGMCTGTFRLAIDDLPRMVETLQRGPDGQRAQPPAAHRPGVGDPLEAPAMGPLPGGGLPDFDLAHTAYQPGPPAPAGAGRHSAPATRHSEPTDYLPGTGQYEAHPPTPRPYLTGSVREAGLPDQPGPQERPLPPGRPDQAGLPGLPGRPDQGGLPGLPGLPNQGGLPGLPGLPDQGGLPDRPMPTDRTGPAPFLTGPESYPAEPPYQPEPPRPRAEYPPDLPGPGPDLGYPPQAPSPRASGARASGARASGTRASGTRVPGPSAPGHDAVDPRMASRGAADPRDPRAAEPRAADPRAANHGAVDPDRYPDDPYGTGLMDYQDAPEPAYYPPGTSASAHREAGGRSDTDYPVHYGGAVTDDIAPPPRHETSPYSRPPGNRRA
jgi:hypothetical protein